jgi:PAS domain-containing protein
VKTEINDFDTCEMQCYNESTADGYDVYVLKYSLDEVSVTENVYYYDHDLSEQIMDQIVNNKIDSIYIEDYLYDEIYMNDAFEEYFNDNVDDIINENPELFSDEEKEFINEEYEIEV